MHHQSTYDAYGFKLSEYNFGDYSTWAPIMGVTFGTPAIQTWYNGTNSQGATVLQDDMAILAGTTNGFGYRSDDHGNTLATATPLSNAGNTWSGSGHRGDEHRCGHVLVHRRCRRHVSHRGQRATRFASNLDVALELRNSAGSLIGTANPQDTHNAEIRKGLDAGNVLSRRQEQRDLWLDWPVHRQH